jgi:hypothetical protein
MLQRACCWARNLKFGYFTQHFVDQLDMTVCPVEIMQKEFPGKRKMVVTCKITGVPG